MSIALLEDPNVRTSEEQFATFYVSNMLLGIDIRQVREINRQLDMTVVPHAPDYVRGVINLRGDVASVLDLPTLLGLPKTEITRESRTLIVSSAGESIGFIVDRISDILTLRDDQISPTPANMNGVQGRFFSGVHTLESEVVVILNIQEALSERNCEE
jgi:purine-binding chemotaxis protein CheW